MKNFIIIFACTMLGIFIYNLVAGNDDSIKSSLSNVWKTEIEQQQGIYP